MLVKLVLACNLFLAGVVTTPESLSVNESSDQAVCRLTRQNFAQWFPDRVSAWLVRVEQSNARIARVAIRFAPEPPAWVAHTPSFADSLTTIIAGASSALVLNGLGRSWDSIIIELEWSESWTTNPNGHPLLTVALDRDILHQEFISVADARQSLIVLFPPDPP